VNTVTEKPAGELTPGDRVPQGWYHGADAGEVLGVFEYESFGATSVMVAYRDENGYPMATFLGAEVPVPVVPPTP
jgi:hypothetical protein